MSFVKQSNANAAATILGKLPARNMEGYFCETCEDAVKKALELMPEGSVISWGGSMSISECGLMDALKKHSYTLIDRASAATEQEKREIYARTVMADYYLMSTNAITMDGELVNIDGFGNRVACLCSGPQNVIIIAGMNKVVNSVEAGIARIRTKAAPPNTTRLTKTRPAPKPASAKTAFLPTASAARPSSREEAAFRAASRSFSSTRILASEHGPCGQTGAAAKPGPGCVLNSAERTAGDVSYSSPVHFSATRF